MSISLTIGTTSLELPIPNSVSISYIRQGSYTKSLDGTLRRAINSDKHQYILGYTRLSINEFNSLKALYDLRAVATFVYDDLSINTVVHIDIGDRIFTPGDPDYYTSMEIILQEI